MGRETVRALVEALANSGISAFLDTEEIGVGEQFPLPYCRSLAQKSDDPDTLFVATGDGAVGTTGAIQRSTNGGKSWQTANLPVKPNSPIWAFATHAADPMYYPLYVSNKWVDPLDRYDAALC